MFKPDPEERYRTCAECGRDCEPEFLSTKPDGGGLRVAFTCPQCGLHTIIDPFKRAY